MQKNGANANLFGAVDKDIQKADLLIKDLLAQIKTGFKNQKEVDNFNKQFQNLNQTLSKVNVGLEQIAKPENFKKQTAELSKLKKQLQDVVNSQSDLKKEASKAVEGFSTKNMRKELNAAVESGTQLEEVLAKISQKQFETAQKTLGKHLSGVKGDTSLLNSAAAKVGTNLFNGDTNKINQYRQALISIVAEEKDVKTAFAGLKNILNETDLEWAESDKFVEQYSNDLRILVNELGKNSNVNKGLANVSINKMLSVGGADINGDYHATGMATAISEYAQALSSVKPLQNEIAQKEKEMKDAAIAFAQNAAKGLAEAAAKQESFAENTNKATSELKETTAQQERLNSNFDSIKSYATMLLSVGNIFYKLRSEIHKTYEDIKSLDKAFGQIAMVTNFSIEDMWNKYDAYAKIANEMGQTTLSVVQASGLYFQQGLKEAEALELTASTMKLATLAGLDFEQATSLMTSAVRGFHMEMSEGEHVTDVYSELAAHAAASVNDIATAMSRTAAIASSAGMEFETTSAMLTTMIEATQESPETLGTAMKTVVARFTELKNNVSATESEFEDLDYNKVDKALKSIGVALKDANGQFRDIDDVFLDVAEKWDTLDRNSQRYVATIAAGSRQQSRFIALMENYDRTLELIDIAQDSAGRSSEQFAKYQDTLENKVNRLRNSWEQLKLSFLNHEMFKNAVEGVNNLINAIGKMDKKKLAAIGIIGVTLGRTLINNIIDGLKTSANLAQDAIKGVVSKIFGDKGILEAKIKIKVEQLDQAKKEIENIKNEFNSLTDTKGFAELFPKVDSALNQLGTKITNLAIEGKKINLDELIEDIITTQGLTKEEADILRNTLKPELESLTDSARETGQQIQNLQKDIQNKQILQKAGQSAGLAFSTAFTTTITAVLATNDPLDVVKANVTTFAMTTIPQAMSKIVGAVVGGLKVIELEEAAATLGISLLIQAAVAAAGVGFVSLRNYLAEQKEETKLANDSVYRLQKTIDSLKESQEEYNEALAESSKAYDEQAEKWEKLDKANKTYKELSSKISLTEDEQEDLNEATNTLAEIMPNLLVGYDSQNNAIIQITDSYEAQIKKQKESYLLAKKQYLLDQQRAKINEIEEKQVEQEQIDEKKKARKNALNTTKRVDFSRTGWGIGADITAGTLEVTNPIAATPAIIRRSIKGGIEAYNGGSFWKGFSQTGIGDAMSGYADTTLKDVLANPDKYGMEGLDVFTDDSTIAEDILNLANEKFKIKGEKYKNTDQVIKKLKKDKEKTKEFFNELNAYYSDVESYSNDLNEDKAATQAALNTLYQEEVDLFYDNLSTELELNSDDFSNLEDNQKQLVTDIIGSSFLNRDDVNKEIERIISENKGDTDKAHSEIQQYLAETFNINNEDFQKIISEVGGDEDLTKTVGKFFEKSLSLSPTELRKNLDGLDVPGTIKDYLNTTIDQIEEGIKETQEKLSKYKVDIPILNGLFDEGKISSTTTKNLSDQVAELESKGEGAAEAYLTGLNKYLSENKFSNETINYLMSIDLDQLDFINGDNYIKKLTSEFVANGLADSIEEAEVIIQDYIDFLNNTELKPKLNIETASDAESWARFGKTAAESFQENFGNLEDIIGVDSDTTEITTDAAKKIQTAFDKIAKDTDKQINFNIYDYITGENDGKLVVSNLQELNDEIAKYANLSSPLIKKRKELKDNEANLTDEEKELLKTLDALIPEMKKVDDATQSSLGAIKATSTRLKELTATIDTLASSYSSMSKEQVENGYLSASSVKGFQDSITSLNQQISDLSIKDFETLDISSFLSKSRYGLVLNKQAMRDYIDELIKVLEATDLYNDEEKELYYNLLATKTAWEQTEKEVAKETADTIKEKYKAWQEALKDIKEKEEAVAEAEEKVREEEEKLLETQEKLQESYYGTAYHKNKTDFLYNYNTELEQLEERLSKAKEALDDLQPGDNAHEKVQEYINALREEITAYKAQNEVIKQYIENQKQMLDNKLAERLEQLKEEGAVDTSTNISDFYYEKNGRFYIDYQKLNAAKLPDDITDFIEEQVENMNNYAKAYEENLDKISDAEKEFRERQKKARDEYLNTENKVVELLKKKDQEELDSLKEKYDGMKEADDEYTDALEKSIKKQRDLRNQANQWDDLAEKEKKLSLQQRDTSGANAKDIKKTQEDIAKTRESLLDSAVDNIINNLKELYEEQEETRQAEIEYRQAILDNKNYVDEATAIINNWGSVEEAKAWFMQFDEEFINASDATIDKLLEDYEGYYNNTVMYNEWMSRSYEEVTNQTAEEIQEKTRETSETLTSETDRALDEIMEDVHEAQEQGRKDVEEAKKAVEEAKEAVVKATEAVAEALEKAKEAQIAYNKAIAAQPTPGGNGGDNNGGGNNGGDNNGGGNNGDGDNKKDERAGGGPATPAPKVQGIKRERIGDKYYIDEYGHKISDYNWGYFILRDGKFKRNFLKYEDMENWFKEQDYDDVIRMKGYWYDGANSVFQYTPFKTGGLVDYTGPAWVDGTPSNPEAFLSATDTRLIREFIDLATLQLNPTEYQNNITSNHTIGDQAFNININVESISSDYDVDQMIERMHEDILSITNEPGQSVMLHK